MNTIQQTSKQYFRSLQIIYFTMIAGQIMFAVITFFLIHSKSIDKGAQELKEIFVYIVPFFVIGSLVGGNVFFRKMMNTYRSSDDLIKKMTGYRSALIVRYALLEGSTLFSIIVYLVTGYWLFLLIAGLMVLIFLILKPTIERAVTELELNANERLKIENPNAVIAEIQTR